MLILRKETAKELSQRKLETYDKYCRVINWGRRYPVEFADRFLGIELLDLQKYMIYNSWTRQFIWWLVCRNGAKSTDMSIYCMLRSLLIPFNTSYFLGNTGEQAKETFTKLEKIAKREIESFTGLTDVFAQEIRTNAANEDGFVHNPASFHVELFNGSEIFTLNSDVVNIKGKRGNVYFDEAAWFSDELFAQAEQFANQNQDFKLGGHINLDLEPKNFPRQLIYASSASDTDSGFYKKGRLFTTRMMMGDENYWACNFDVNAILKATVNGDVLKVPLISQEKVDKAMSDDREKALRELYNKFSADAHAGQILTRRDLRQHTKPYLPILTNENGQHQFIMSWDSARLNDNSVIEIAELINDPEIGWRMRMANVVSLVDIKAKNKAPMTFPDQVKHFKKLLLNYNGSFTGKLDYENIVRIVADAGAAGQIIGGVSDYLLEDWEGPDKKKHKGLIDRQHKANASSRDNYPDAVDIMSLVDPRSNRNLIYKAVEDMVKLGVVEFPVEYADQAKDYVVLFNEEGVEEKHELSVEQQVALTQMEILKTEAVTMCKVVNKGSESYDYPPDKRNVMHDDRIFAFGLLCWYLAQLRRGQIIEKKPDPVDIMTLPVTVSAVDFI